MTASTRPSQATGVWRPVVASLLPVLSARVPSWAVLKNHDRLPDLHGDLDTCLSRDRWDEFIAALVDVLRPWAPCAIVHCDHFLGVRLLFVASMLPGGRGGRCLEIDLADGIWWKGTQLAPAPTVTATAVTDERGFRRVGSGWEAAALLTLSCIGRTGTLRPEIVGSRRVREKADADPSEFVGAMTRLHGRAGAIAAERFVGDRWTAGTGAALVRHRVATDPLGWASCALAFARRKALNHWRGLPRIVGDDPGAWLRRSGRHHLAVRVEAG